MFFGSIPPLCFPPLPLIHPPRPLKLSFAKQRVLLQEVRPPWNKDFKQNDLVSLFASRAVNGYKQGFSKASLRGFQAAQGSARRKARRTKHSYKS